MIKLFISYCHKDEFLVENFIKHIKPLKDNNIIDEWYDRKIKTGNELQKDIDNNFEKTNIICLMISNHFFSSDACMKEKDFAFTLRSEKNIRIIPIILSPCAWTTYYDLSKLLAVPTDGKPVTSFQDQNEGWVDVVTWIKNVCLYMNLIHNLKVKDEFEIFLNNTELLAKSHKEKETLLLKDIFVFPKLTCYKDSETSHKYDSARFITEILQHGKIIIAGDNQSGKTTLCKELFRIYRNLDLVPVYLENDNKHLGNPLKNIEKAFDEQYDAIDLKKIDKHQIVPIVDNFHTAKHQEKYIEQYCEFPYQVLIVDDIFELNIKNQKLVQEYKKFEIREFTPLERNELIQKWVQITEDRQIQLNLNHLQQRIDEETEKIENTLGVTFGKGIVPSYPFFILTLLSAQDTQRPLDTEITSQGYCYQVLIYLYLRKAGVGNDQIDTYMNFLTELAFWLYCNKSDGLNQDELTEFEKYYDKHFNIGNFTFSEIKKILSKVNICAIDSLNQYHFCYDYLYYFFVAKYLSEHIEEKEKEKLIDNILSNLHKDENAYIAIFITHHTKSDYVLDNIVFNALTLFEKYKPATLDTEELSFFDRHQEQVIKAVLPTQEHSVNAERKKLLDHKSSIEENSKSQYPEHDDNELELIKNIRLGIKTVEVMGLVIKNRSGSLERDRLESIFEEGLNVHLRIMSSFLELIQNEQTEKEIIEYLTEKVDNMNKKNAGKEKISLDEIKKRAKKWYWNLNFGVLLGFLTKSIHSLGSNNLLKIADSINKKENSPAVFIVNHGIKMWYAKNVRIDEISHRLRQKDFSLTAEKLMKYKIVEHCHLHKINFRDRQKLVNTLQMSQKKLLMKYPG